MRGNLKVVQSKIIARKRKQLIYKIVFTIFFISLAFFGLGLLSQLSFFNIESIKILNEVPESDRKISDSQAIALVQKQIAGNYIGLFSKSNYFIFPKQSILKEFKTMSFIEDVFIDKEGFKDVAIELIERSEAMRWCDDGVDAKCFSADKKGFIYATSTYGDDYFSTDSVKRPVIYRGALAGGPIGENVFSEQEFSKITFFVNELGAMGLVIREVVFGETSYLTVILSNGCWLIINSGDDLTSVLSNLKSVISEFSLENLDYVRLDSGNKIFIKEKTAIKQEAVKLEIND